MSDELNNPTKQERAAKERIESASLLYADDEDLKKMLLTRDGKDASKKEDALNELISRAYKSGVLSVENRRRWSN